MKFLIRQISLLVCAISITAFIHVSLADSPDLLSKVIPSKDVKKMIARRDQISAQVKKIPFPTKDRFLHHLTQYTYDAFKDRDFTRAYQTVLKDLPQSLLQHHSWLVHLENAVSMPTEYWSTPQGYWVKLWACEPHNCPNDINVFYNPIHQRIWGVVHISDAPEKYYLVGHPSEDELALLFVIMSRESTGSSI